MAFLAFQFSVPWILIIFFLGCLIYKALNSGHRAKYLPPGPPTLPILGNAHQIPSSRLFSQFKQWSDQYGAIFSLKIGRSTIVVLNDPRAVHELLNKQGALYADRPTDEQWNIACRDENLALMHTGDSWRTLRKVLTQVLSPKSLDGDLAKVQEAEITRLMVEILEKPNEFRSSIQRTTLSVASVILYGQRAPDWNSFWASDFHDATQALSRAIQPGSYPPYELFPFLKLIPDCWISSKRLAKETYHHCHAIFTKARELVEERRNNGDTRDSLLDRVLDGTIEFDTPLTYSQINDSLLGTAHEGASDTLSSQSLTNILFLAKHPQFQEKARLELDRICGTERVPRWSDFEALPYINCIIKEGLRIAPVLPLGIPYCAKEDVWYDGMLIPKNATVFLPVHALNHTYHSDAESYNPDRYLNHPKHASDYANSPDYANRDHYAFGTGRRICVGQFLAERTLWRIVAQLLWAFKIEPVVNEKGETVSLDTSKYEDGFAQKPTPYAVKIVPRSKKHAEVIRRDYAAVEAYLKQWE